MSGIPLVLLLGEGFAVYRETANVQVCVLISRDYPFLLFIVRPRLAAVPEHIVGFGLVAVPEEDVVAGMEPV